MQNNPTTPVLYTVQEVADILRVHKRTAYRLITSEALKAIKIGNQWRVPEQALMDFLQTGWKNSVPEKDIARKSGARQLKLPFEE